MKNKIRQYRSNQGRSPHQQRGNNAAAFFSVVGLLIMFIIIAITQ